MGKPSWFSHLSGKTRLVFSPKVHSTACLAVVRCVKVLWKRSQCKFSSWLMCSMKDHLLILSVYQNYKCNILKYVFFYMTVNSFLFCCFKLKNITTQNLILKWTKFSSKINVIHWFKKTSNHCDRQAMKKSGQAGLWTRCGKMILLLFYLSEKTK